MKMRHHQTATGRVDPLAAVGKGGLRRRAAGWVVAAVVVVVVAVPATAEAEAAPCVLLKVT